MDGVFLKLRVLTPLGTIYVRNLCKIFMPIVLNSLIKKIGLHLACRTVLTATVLQLLIV